MPQDVTIKGANGVNRASVTADRLNVELSSIDSSNPLPTTSQLSIETVIDETAYDLNAAVYSQVVNPTYDYIIDNASFEFSTTESRTITITSANGSKIYESTTTNLSVIVASINFGQDNTQDFTVAITQTSGACTVDVTVNIKNSPVALTSDPILAAGTNVVGKVGLVNSDRDDITVQEPLPTDGDSVYEKDLWLSESTSTDFTGGDITDLFNNLHTQITNVTSNNPKTLFIHFNRTIVSNAIGLGAAISENFSNVKIEIVNSGGVYSTVIDESASATKYTSRTFQLPVTAGFNALKITFHTADTITLSNCVILKTGSVVARLQAKKPDNTITDINATTGGNLKVSMEELESGISTNGNSQLNVSIYDAYGNIVNDGTSDAIVTISHGHHEVHNGSHYYIEGYTTLGSGVSLFVKLVTPDTTEWSHFVWDISSSLELVTKLTEAPTGGMTGGANATIFNSDRNSLNTSGMVITQGVTACTGGTIISQTSWGSRAAGGSHARDEEIILKQNTVYCREITSGVNSNIVSFKASWYEHTNKN